MAPLVHTTMGMPLVVPEAFMPARDGEAHRQDVRRRWAIMAVSVAGAASMAATSLLQLGIVRNLPDPRVRLFGLPFRSKKVNLSSDAYVLGMRDGPVALASFLVNLPMALAGGRRRERERLLWPIVFAAKALGEAVGAAIFFSKMPRKERAWCAYCIAAAIASTSVFALSVPEALRAARLLRRGRGVSSLAPLRAAP